MRDVLRVGFVVSALLSAPIAAAATATAQPVELRPQPAVEQQQDAAEDVGVVCTMQYPPSPLCLLSSLSASGS